MPASHTFIPSPEPNVRLKLIVARPPTSDPVPTIIFNHGSTGRGHNPAVFKRVWSPPFVQDYFTQRGWMVIFPQRRGRGGSEGVYGEGLATDGSGYSCEPGIAVAGFERAVADIDAVMGHLKTRKDVDFRRIAIGGVSISTAAGSGAPVPRMRPSTRRSSEEAPAQKRRRSGCMAATISITASPTAGETSTAIWRRAETAPLSPRRWAIAFSSSRPYGASM